MFALGPHLQNDDWSHNAVQSRLAPPCPPITGLDYSHDVISWVEPTKEDVSLFLGGLVEYRGVPIGGPAVTSDIDERFQTGNTTLEEMFDNGTAG